MLKMELINEFAGFREDERKRILELEDNFSYHLAYELEFDGKFVAGYGAKKLHPPAVSLRYLSHYMFRQPSTWKSTQLHSTAFKEVTDFIIIYDASHTPSIDWFKNEFPAYQDMFSNYVNFIFSPCQLIKLSHDKKTMTCESADPTCLMNKIHACAGYLIADQQSLANFITCTFEKGAGSIKNCVTDQNLATQIDTCSKQNEGFQHCVTFSESVDKPIPVEMIPFVNMPTNFFGYKPYLTTDAVCIWLGFPRPPKCPKDF